MLLSPINILCLIITTTQICYGAKILAIFPFPSKSHFTYSNAILKSLIKAGHDVTIITSFPEQASAENYTSVINAFKDEFIYVSKSAYTDLSTLSLYKIIDMGLQSEKRYCQAVMDLPLIQKILNTDEKIYDVLIIGIVLLHECYLPVAEKLQIPVIGTTALRTWIQADIANSNPHHPGIIPSEIVTPFQREDFYNRLWNVWYHAFTYFYRYFAIESALDEFHRKNQHQLSSIANYRNRKLDLIFYNNHPSYLSRPLNPNVIEIAGIYIEKAKPLPDDIGKFIDEAQHGVILFTFGSLTRAAASSQHVINAFKDAFAEIPQRVIWKYEETMPNVPKNVIIKSWLPQRDILEHKNVIAFISHCGLGGTYEAIYTTTPVIACPLFCDQDGNAALLENAGAAVHLDINSISKSSVLKALKLITNDTRYYDNMQKLSKVFKDRPMTPQQSVVYWTEYIIRHNGAHHLKTAAAQLTWYQYLLLDVLCVVLLSATSIAFLIYKIIRLLRNEYTLNFEINLPSINLHSSLSVWQKCEFLSVRYDNVIITDQYSLSDFYKTRTSNAAKILAIFPSPAKSHFAYSNAILKSLTNAGHDITVITAFPELASAENYTSVINALKNDFIYVSNSAYTDLSTLSFYDLFKMGLETEKKYCQTMMDLPLIKKILNYDFTINQASFQIISELNILELLYLSLLAEKPYCQRIIESPEIQKIMNSDEKLYDVVFVELSLLHKCYLPIAAKLDVPIIGTMTARIHAYGYNFDGFNEFVINIWYLIVHLWYQYWIIEPILEEFYKDNAQLLPPSTNYKNLQPDIVFYNNHPSYSPELTELNFIEIGGIHIQPAEPLPRDIEKFIDEVEHGVILLSFGSCIRSASITLKIRNAFKDAFAEIPQRIIWKYEETIANLPSNIMLEDWLSQRDILAFISHCGQGGTYEAIHPVTPVIACPLFADQPGNTAISEKLGVAVSLDLQNISKNDVLRALNTIINETKYYDNMQKLSKIFKDRPMTPQQSVVYWTEHVIRHHGASYLNTSNSRLTLCRNLLVELAIVSLLAAIFIFLTYKIIKLILFCALSMKNKCYKNYKNKSI